LNRKLLLLNTVLIAAAVVVGMRARERWQEAKAREQAILRQTPKPLPPPPFAPLPEAEPVQPATYADIAQQMLFSKDRNPVVVIEKPAPPPPKPMPALPVVFGVMNIDGPTAILAEKSGAQPRELRPGQVMGEFKLLAVNGQQIVFEWDGKRVERKIDDLVYRDPSEKSEAPRSQGSVAAPLQASAPPPRAQVAAPSEPGVDVGGGVKACQPGDPSPAGTIAGGMRKVVTASPFGNVCRWEPVQR
jgi:hypothetical protein